jgi:hypothetical protein
MTTYFGFAIADSMFPTTCTVSRRSLTVEEVRDAVSNGVTSCLNPSHAATIAAMKVRCGIDAPIPEKAPNVRCVELSARLSVNPSTLAQASAGAIRRRPAFLLHKRGYDGRTNLREVRQSDDA